MLYFTIADAMPSKKEFLKTPFFPLSDDIQSNNDHFSKTNFYRGAIFCLLDTKPTWPHVVK